MIAKEVFQMTGSDRNSGPLGAPRTPADITPELIDSYVRLGRRLRAEAMQRWLRGLGHAGVAGIDRLRRGLAGGSRRRRGRVRHA